MRYTAITIIAFIVVVGVSMLAARISAATSALDVEVELNLTVRRLAELKLEILSTNRILLGAPKGLPNHPWVENWQGFNKSQETQKQIEQHLKNQNTNQAWVVTYQQLITERQTELGNLALYLLDRARNTLVFSAISSLFLVASVLSIVFLFIFRSQRIHLSNSEKLNEKFRQQRETLLASQRAMISITDDEKRAHMRAEQLASLVEQSSEAFIRLDVNGYIEHSNQSASLLLPNLVTNAPFVNSFDSEQSQALSDAIETAIKQHKAVTITPDSENIENAIEFTIAPVIDTGTSGICISILARDVSARMREQEQLKQVIENAPNALFVCDQDVRIVMANIHAEQLFGYRESELIGLLINDLVSESQRATLAKARAQYIKQLRKAHIGQDRNLLALRKDGTEFPVEIGLNPIYVGEELFVTLSFFDLTQQRKQQEQLEAANDALELRNAEMEQFIYTVSHDLKSPLFTISGFTHGLRNSIENITEDQAHQADRIQANVDRMGELLEDLLQLSRVIRIDIEMKKVDTTALAKQVIAALEGVIQSSNAKIEVVEPLATVHGNEGMIFQCLQNLITNAIRYVDDGVNPILRIYTTEEDGNVILHVADNGIGIDPKHHEKIFGIFQRLNTKQGSGVGLSIVKTIMDRHDGHVLVDSELGQGSTFSLVFTNQKLA